MSTSAPVFRKCKTEVCTGIPVIAKSLVFLLLCSSVPSFVAIAKGSMCQTISSAASKDKARLLFFTASWCAPCHRLQPVVEKICRRKRSVLELVIIDYDEYPTLVADFGVESLPTLILLDGSGKLRLKVNGASKEGMDALSAEIKRLSKSAR